MLWGDNAPGRRDNSKEMCVLFVNLAETKMKKEVLKCIVLKCLGFKAKL